MGGRLRRIIAAELRVASLWRSSQAKARILPYLYRNVAHLNASSVWNPRRFFSSDSFMQSIINQVKQDLEKDEKLKEAIKSLEDSKITQKVNKIGEIIAKSKDLCSHYVGKVSETSSSSRAMKLAATSAKSIVVGINKVAEMLHDEEREVKNLRNKWKQRVVNQRSHNARDDQSKADETSQYAVNEEQTENNNQEYALVLAKESAWERFGSHLRDMPFLTNFFENPVFEQLFGKSTIATAIKEMKKVDPSFSLPELLELVEHVVAPHIVHCYLDGNAEALKVHCGECAFNVLNASIRERNLQKLSLDTNILILKDVELKGSVTNPDTYPWFIFNFTTQQINCLRDSHGKIVAGEIDDIREVVYSMALSRHPNLALDNLEYPYIVS